MSDLKRSNSTISLVTLAGGSALAIVSGAVAVGVAGSMLSWGSGAEILRAGLLVCAVVLVAALAAHALIVLVLDPARDRLAGLVVAGGMARMLVSLLLAMVVFMMAAPEGRTFWFGFLASGLLCLVVETWWGMAAVRAAHGCVKESSET
ncbi:MAG: hypothetical protein AABZ53_10880 [Planctomycetota bacterium]